MINDNVPRPPTPPSFPTPKALAIVLRKLGFKTEEKLLDQLKK